MKYFFSLLLFIFSFNLYATDKVVLWERNFVRDDFRELIELALDLTQSAYGDYQLIASVKLEQGRAFADLQKGDNLDVFVAGISKDREALVRPIYYPVDRGLLGFRICMIRKELQNAFADINTLGDFQALDKVVGVGTHWPDRDVIETNGLRTLHSVNYESLFDMLKFSRFDCFLRSINEIDAELHKLNDANIIAESHLALIYPAADFVFVSPKRPELKQRIETGLMMAVESGDFSKHFQKHYYRYLQKYQFYRRKLLFLNNNDITDEGLDSLNLYGVASFAQ